jgi:hypothetical protein
MAIDNDLVESQKILMKKAKLSARQADEIAKAKEEWHSEMVKAARNGGTTTIKDGTPVTTYPPVPVEPGKETAKLKNTLRDKGFTPVLMEERTHENNKFAGRQ